MEYKRTNVLRELPNRAFADLNNAVKSLPTSRSVTARVACVTLTTGHGSNVAKLCGPATVRADRLERNING
jgi:hypothetical protein